MKKLLLFITLLLSFFTYSNAQWKSIPTNLATIYFHSINADQILVKVNQNDCFRLEKNSNNWEPINTNFIELNQSLNSVEQNKNLMLVLEATTRNIFISEDYGKSFKKFETINNASNFNNVLFNHNTNRIYLSSSGGVKLQYSDDNGKTWNPDTLGIEFLQHHVPSRIYNLDTMEIQESNTGIYFRNTLKNETWRRIDSKIKLGIARYELIKHQEAILVSTSSGIFQFNGLDSAWLTYGKNIPIQFVHNIQSLGRFIFINQTRKGVYVSEDKGQTWSYLYLDTLLNTDFQINKFNNKIVAFTTTGVYNLDTSNFKWEKLGNNLSAIRVNGLAKANNKVYTSSFRFGIVESDLTVQYQHIMPKNSPKKIFIKDNIIYTSSNIGAFQKEITSNTWTELHPLLTAKNFVQSALENDTLFFINQAECMAFSINNASCVKIGSGVNDNQITDLISYKGKLFTLSRNAIYILNRASGIWDIIELNLSDEIFNKACVYKEKLLVATSNGIFYLNDSFNNWIPLDSTQKLGNISAIHPHNDKLFWAASNGQGVYFCENLNAPFYPFSGNLPNMEISAFFVDNDTLYLGGSKDVWFRPMSELKTNLAEKTLSDNPIIVYPNPAKNEIIIGFENTGPAKIKLTDILGKIWLENTLEASDNTIQVSQLPNGIYFLTIQQNNKNFVQKIVIDK